MYLIERISKGWHAVLAAWLGLMTGWALPDAQPRPLLSLPYTIKMGTIVVPVSLNGSEPIQCVLDTGMPRGFCLFAPALAEPLALEYQGTVQVDGGGTASKAGRLAAGGVIRLGPLELGGLRLIVLNERHEIADYGIEGVLGASLFHAYVVRFDVDRKMVDFFKPEHFEPDSGHGRKLPIEIVNDVPYLDAQVDLEGRGDRAVRLLLDTGKNGTLSLVGLDDLRNFSPKQSVASLLSTGLSGDVHGFRGRIQKLELGGHGLRQVIAEFPKPQADGTFQTRENGALGMGVLRRFILTVDYGKSRLFLQPSGHFADPFELNMAGLLLRGFDGRGLYVKEVIPDAPGDQAGLKPQDRILTIDGRRVQNLNYDDIQTIFQREHAVVSLKVQREGDPFQVNLALRRLL